MNKKSLAKGLTAAALVGVVAIGSTLAYLSVTTASKTNNFSSSKNIVGQIEESDFKQDKANNYEPGEAFAKTPKVSINQGSENAYAAMSVDYYGLDVITEGNATDGYKVTSGTKVSQTEFAKYATVDGWNTQDWTAIAKSENGSELYMHNNVLDSTTTVAKTAGLFTGMTVNAGLNTILANNVQTTKIYTFTDTNFNGKLDEAEAESMVEIKDKSSITPESIIKTNYVDATGATIAIDKLPAFVLDVKGYAIQAENTDAVREAELIKLANKGREGKDVFVAL